MEPEVEDDDKASVSPLNELKPPYSPSWPSDDEEEEDEEGPRGDSDDPHSR